MYIYRKISCDRGYLFVLLTLISSTVAICKLLWVLYSPVELQLVTLDNPVQMFAICKVPSQVHAEMTPTFKTATAVNSIPYFDRGSN